MPAGSKIGARLDEREICTFAVGWYKSRRAGKNGAGKGITAYNLI